MINVPDHGNRQPHTTPRSIVRIDGKEMWFNSWSVNLNSASQADDFSIEFPFRIMKEATPAYLINTIEHPSHLLVKSDILVEIFVGYPEDPGKFDASSLKRIMYGVVDSIEINCSSSGEIVSISGRNMVAAFLDHKTNGKFPNLTASEIAKNLAANRRMKTEITDTFTKVGAYANEDSVEMDNDSQSEWDLLTHLAEQEGFIARVIDDTLYFGPFEEQEGVGRNAPEIYNYTWGQNILDFSIIRNPHAAKNLYVDVHSYNSSSGQHVLASVHKHFEGAESDYRERHFFNSLNQEQAEYMATSILTQLGQNELTGTLHVSGNEKLRVDGKIALYGVGHLLSDIYFIKKAAHKFSLSDGFRTELSISNFLMGGEACAC
jgi:phage protein D